MRGIYDAVKPENRARECAADRVAYMATELSVTIGLVTLRTARLEERLHRAAERGVSRAECEKMLCGLDGIDIQAMLDRAYAPQQQEEPS